MRILYTESWSEKLGADHSKYIFSDRIPQGHVLHVHTCFAHAPEREATELIHLGVRNGGKDILVRARGPAVAAEGMSARRDFFVGEGDQIFAYFPSAAENDTIELHIIGHLMAFKDWRDMVEHI